MEERRSCGRWDVNCQAKIRLEGAESFADCQIKELNLKGMQACLGMKLAKDNFIKLCLFLAEGFCFDIECWVVWHKIINGSNTYGFYFSRIKDQDREKIYKFIHRRYPEKIKCQYCQDRLEETPSPIGRAGVRYCEGGEVMSGPRTDDRRIFERFRVDFPLKFFNLDSNMDGEGRVCEISAKGVGMVTREPLPAPSPVELWLRIPDKSEPLYVRGNVVWSSSVAPSEYRAGVNLEKAELLGLSRVLRAVKPEA